MSGISKHIHMPSISFVGLTQSKLLLGEELVLAELLDLAGEHLLRGRWDNVSKCL